MKPCSAEKNSKTLKFLSKLIKLETIVLIEVIQKDKPVCSFMFVDSRFESLHVTTNSRVTKKMWRHKRNYWQRERGIRHSREEVSRTQEL